MGHGFLPSSPSYLTSQPIEGSKKQTASPVTSKGRSWRATSLINQSLQANPSLIALKRLDGMWGKLYDGSRHWWSPTPSDEWHLRGVVAVSEWMSAMVQRRRRQRAWNPTPQVIQLTLHSLLPSFGFPPSGLGPHAAQAARRLGHLLVSIFLLPIWLVPRWTDGRTSGRARTNVASPHRPSVPCSSLLGATWHLDWYGDVVVGCSLLRVPYIPEYSSFNSADTEDGDGWMKTWHVGWILSTY